MKIAVFGVGGVGGYFGGRLAQAGHDTVFIARGDHLAAIRKEGLRVTSIEGDFTIHPVRATDDPGSVGPVDTVILGVKSWQVRDAAVAVRPMVGDHTLVLPLQNGIEAPEHIADILGPDHAVGGLCRIISAIEGPGRIRHFGARPHVAFGELDNRHSDRVKRLLAAFSDAIGLDAEIPRDIRLAMWQKFLLIVPLSGMGALTRSPIGVFRQLPETREILESALGEVLDVANANGVALDTPDVERVLAIIDGMPADATASMQRDIMDGRPSELHEQVGAVVRLARRLNVPTPVNRFIYGSLLAQENQARAQPA